MNIRDHKTPEESILFLIKMSQNYVTADRCEYRGDWIHKRKRLELATNYGHVLNIEYILSLLVNDMLKQS